MFQRIDFNKESDSVGKFKEAFKVDKVILNDFARVLSSNACGEMAKKHQISLGDYFILHKLALARVQDAKAVDFKMEIKKENGVYARTTDAVTMFFRGVVAQKKIEGASAEEMLSMSASQLHSLIDYKEGKPVVAENVNGLSSVMKFAPAPVAKVVDVLAGAEVRTSEQAHEQLVQGLVKDKSYVLLEALAAASPPRYKVNIVVENEVNPVIGASGVVNVDETIKKVINNTGKVPRVLAVSAASPQISINTDPKEELIKEAKMFLSRVSGKCFPRTSGIGVFSDRHVYGMDVRKDMAKYVSFLTDCTIPDNVKEVHLYSSDLKYAVGIINRYPKVTVKVASSYTQDCKSRIQPWSRKELLKSNHKGVMGIFVDYKTVNRGQTYDHYEQSKLVDADDYDEAHSYDIMFRYVDYHAVRNDKDRYYLSAYTRDDKVCESTTRTPLFGGSAILVAFSAACLHRYSFVWHTKPLYLLVPDYYNDMLGLFDFSISRKNALDVAQSGLMSMLLNDKNDYYSQLVHETVSSYVSEHKVIVNDRPAINNNTDNSRSVMPTVNSIHVVSQSMFADCLGDDDEGDVGVSDFGLSKLNL